MPAIVIGFDLGRTAAACIGAPGRKPELITREFPIEYGAMASEFEGFVRGIIRKNNAISVFAWERPFIALRVKSGKAVLDAQGEIRTQRLYGQFHTLRKLAWESGLQEYFERPSVVRRDVIGKGNATSDDIMKFTHKAGLRPANDHEADAYVIWRAAIGKFNLR